MDLATTLVKLREDRALYFNSPAEILSSTQRALERAEAALPGYFATLPAAECVMREIPDYEAPYSTIAYYSKPHYDGTKPGEYFVNTYKPDTRPKYEIEALTGHESIRGHHLHRAVARARRAAGVSQAQRVHRLQGRLGALRRVARRRDGPLLERPRSHWSRQLRRLALCPADRRHFAMTAAPE